MFVKIWCYSGFIMTLSMIIYWSAPRVDIHPNLLVMNRSAVRSLNEIQRLKLNPISLLFEEQIVGPVSFTHDPITGDIFTGTHDGLVWKINKELTHAEPLLRIGEENLECGFVENQKICGRVLGVKFLTGDKLIVADAYMGIFAIHVNSKRKQVLVQPDRNMLTRSLKLFNSVDVSKEGVIFFTVSSMKWSLQDFIYSVMEADSTSRVYSYNLLTRELKIIASNLTCATGISITHKEDGVLISEFMKRRIMKIDTKNPKNISIFADNLSGFSGNIRRGSDGTYFVVIHSLGSLELLSFVFNHPSINAWLAWLLPRCILHRLTHLESTIIQIDDRGQFIRVWDNKDKTIRFVSDAYESDGNMVFGSMDKPYLAVVKKHDIRW